VLVDYVQLIAFPQEQIPSLGWADTVDPWIWEVSRGPLCGWELGLILAPPVTFAPGSEPAPWSPYLIFCSGLRERLSDERTRRP